MRPPLLALLLAFFGLAAAAATPPSAPATATAQELAQGFRNGVVLAKPFARHRATAGAAEAHERIQVRRTFARFGDIRVIGLDGHESVAHAVARLQATGRYEFVEPSHLLQANSVPNDPGFPAQWALANTGQTPGGTAGADIGAIAAWDISHDAPGVIVAILDSGARLTHPDLVPNLWRNPAPTFGDLHGARFTGGNGIATSGNPTDDFGHGTRMAGIIGAAGNNGLGLAGVAWKVQLMPLKHADSTGGVHVVDSVAAIDYALAHGATIINYSFSFIASNLTAAQASQTLLAALQAAREAGVIVVCSAGNNGVNLDLTPVFPANSLLDNVVTVGGTRPDDAVGPGNFGATVDLFAPGTAIATLSSVSDTTLVTQSGTSYSAAYVTASLALLKARFPSDSYRQLINRLLRATDRKPAYAGKAQSGGRLNLLAALTGPSNRPMNDAFSERAVVSGITAHLRSNNTGATTEPGEAAHAGAPAAATLWWEWTAPQSGPTIIDTDGSDYDTVAAVYTGTTPGPLTAVAANENAPGRSTSRVSFAARAGTTYQFAVGSRTTATGLTVVRLAQLPLNDDLAQAIALNGPSLQIKGSNVNATPEAAEVSLPGVSAMGNSVWYRWTAPRSGLFQIAVISDGFDPLLSLHTAGTDAAPALVDFNDNTGANLEVPNSLLTLHARAGATYLIKVDSAGVSTTGDFTLTVTDSLWQMATRGELLPAATVAPDGTVYIGGITSGPTLYAVAPDGRLRWRLGLPGGVGGASPAVGPDGVLYFGLTDGSVRAINPEGSLRWSRVIVAGRSAAYSPALAADGTLYLHTDDGFLNALNSATGATRWRFNVGARATPASAAIAPDGTVYQPSDDGGIYAINPDGTLRWRFDAGSPMASSPALDAAGNLYVTTLVSARLLSLTASGTLRWSYAGAGVSITGSPTLGADGATVYFGAHDRKLHAVDAATGTARWTYALGAEAISGSPAIDANGVIYLGGEDGLLHAVNPDGTARRTWHTGDAIRSSPAITGTVLYVGSLDGKLYAFELGAAAAAGPWPQYRQNPRRLGRVADEILAITAAPRSQSVALGGTVTLEVSATGSGPLAYQWQKDGLGVTGATGSRLTLANAAAADSGRYTVTVTGPQGRMTGTPATVVVAPADSGRISHVAFRASLTAGNPTLVVGFNVTGPAPAPLLLRAVGPTLERFGVAGAMADPQLQLLAGTTLLASNNDWASPSGGGGPAEIAAAFAAAGAFPLDPGSRDAALVRSLAAGRYAAEVRGGTGSVLVELDHFASPVATRLLNASVLAAVGAGGNSVIAGFVISGNRPKTVLLRAVGPGLAQFGVAGVLANPRIDVYRDSTYVMGNDDHLGLLGPASAQAGAFRFTGAATLDAALAATLDPGAYAVQVSGVNNSTGLVLVELYEMP